MKKYFFGLLGILLLGGVVTAQADTLEDVGFTVEGITLPQNNADAYVLITNGDSEKNYEINFSTETSPSLDLEGSMDIGLCLEEIDEELAATLAQYYEARGLPELYLEYLLSAVEGKKPFAVVRIDTEADPADDVKLCDGAVLGVEKKCVPMRIPGDYPNGMYSVSSCGAGDPALSFQLVIVSDVDGDGVTDDADLCPNSDLTGDLEGTVVIDECDSGVANALFEDGCTISDRVMACADGAENHGEFVSCVSHFTNELKPQALSGAEKGAIQSCAAQSNIGGLPCESNCDEDSSGLGQNRHRARYELFDNDLVIPCVDIGAGQYIAVDMNLSSATSKNFHF